MAESVLARLYLLAGSDLARSIGLGERATLGRSDECDVVLHDRSISRKHAVIVRQGEAWFVQDLGSTNGISKNGKRAERIELEDGDEFRLGDVPLRFRVSSEPETGGDELEFADDVPAPPSASPPAARSAEPAVPAADAEVEIEDEIEIEGADGSPVAGARAELAATVFSPVRRERRSSFLGGDIEQRPFWVRCLIVLVLLAFSAGIFYGAVLAVETLRSGM